MHDTSFQNKLVTELDLECILNQDKETRVWMSPCRVCQFVTISIWQETGTKTKPRRSI